MGNKGKAILLYTSALFSLTFGAAIMKKTVHSTTLNVSQVIFYKALIFSILFSPKCLPQISLIQRKHIPLFLLTCCLGIYDAYIVNLCWSNLPINNVTIFSFLHPFIMTLLAWLILKERILLRHIIAMFIGFFGVCLAIDWHSHAGDIMWYGLMLSNLFASSLGWIFLKKLTGYYSSTFIAYLRVLSIAVASIFLLHYNGTPFIAPYEQYPALLFISALYIYERLSISKTYSMIDVSIVQPLKFMNILFSITCGYFILSEKLSYNQAISMLAVCIALYIGYGKLPRLSSNK